MNPKVSIIIPCKNIDPLTQECLDGCKRLDYRNIEIIVLPDQNTTVSPDITVIATGEVSPGRKRNIGMKNSTGEFLAFIDSDAQPQKAWLTNALQHFTDDEVAAVGGPGITPENSSILQKAGGYILSSFMVGGLSNRYNKGKSFESDDIHSCNFIVRRAVLEEIGGWNEKYWPGEDTLMCLAIKKHGKKMIESPDVVVIHHRRPLFKKHLIQVSRFGMHRGFFAKRFPETSLRLNYFIPSFFVLFMMVGAVFPLNNIPVPLLYTGIILIYIFMALMVSFTASLKEKDIRYLPLVFIGTISTHIAYGVNFLMGLASRELKR